MINVLFQVQFKLDGTTRQQIMNQIRLDQYKQTFRAFAADMPSKTVCIATDSFHMRAEFTDATEAALFDAQFKEFVKSNSGVELP